MHERCGKQPNSVRMLVAVCHRTMGQRRMVQTLKGPLWPADDERGLDGLQRGNLDELFMYIYSAQNSDTNGISGSQSLLEGIRCT
jgi:hypothetical protein